VQYSPERVAEYVVQDASGDAVAVCSGEVSSRVLAQLVYDAFGNVLKLDEYVPYSPLRLGRLIALAACSLIDWMRRRLMCTAWRL
jgi:hypothetical protein